MSALVAVRGILVTLAALVAITLGSVHSGAVPAAPTQPGGGAAPVGQTVWICQWMPYLSPLCI